MRVLEDYADEFYGDSIKKYFEALERGELADGENTESIEETNKEEAHLDIEERIRREVEDLKQSSSTGFKTKEEKKKELFSGMEIGCECGKC